MQENQTISSKINLGFPTKKVHYQLRWQDLVEETLNLQQGRLTQNGALHIETGKFTGRSPKDRFIVRDAKTEDSVWWDGTINLPFSPERFDALHKKMLNFIRDKEVYVRDAFACAEPTMRVHVRSVNTTPWSNLFIYNMFIRPSTEELAELEEPDWLVIQIPEFFASPVEDGTESENFSILNFSKKIALIGGSGYTGEMKKGIFSALNFELPLEKEVLTMHCSANRGKDGDSALFFGLSGTGKTTLSADADRFLIGDDEHGWTPDNTIFNFEGGCYAKVIDLSKENEPEIFGAIKPGALLENCGFYPDTNEVNYSDTSITQNTRVSYPIHHIKNALQPSSAKNPKHIFFLTFDAFGVLPAIAKLNPAQAAYHFISGYTSKVAGTELGVTKPETTFSACFGAPFMPLHPNVYGTMLSEKIQANDVHVWLVNTGLNGTGKRMKLSFTRSLIHAALEGELEKVAFLEDPYFGFHIPKESGNLSENDLNPMKSWESQTAYEEKALELCAAFRENFEQFAEQTDSEILKGGPKR